MRLCFYDVAVLGVIDSCCPLLVCHVSSFGCRGVVKFALGGMKTFVVCLYMTGVASIYFPWEMIPGVR